MRLSVSSAQKASLGAWLLLGCLGIILSFGSHLDAANDADLRRKLAAGEVIVTATAEPGTCLKHGEIIGVIDASPEIVWQVVTDVNSFKFFMPRTLNSMAVAPDQVPVIVAAKPGSAAEVERLLGPTPANLAAYRRPGGKYIIYTYSNLEFPWPCSNRWYIIKGENDETQAAQHRYHSAWSLVIGNLKANSGEWLLEPFGAGQTKVVYRLCTDPGGDIPGVLVQQGTYSTMPQIIAAVRERARKLLTLKRP
jgi:ribosome-associated toxin RatA of RatAB toxin-antitoxin module